MKGKESRMMNRAAKALKNVEGAEVLGINQNLFVRMGNNIKEFFGNTINALTGIKIKRLESGNESKNFENIDDVKETNYDAKDTHRNFVDKINPNNSIYNNLQVENQMNTDSKNKDLIKNQKKDDYTH